MNQSLQSQYSTANYGTNAGAGGASLKVKLNQLEVTTTANNNHYIGNRVHDNGGDPVQQEGGADPACGEGVA